MKASKVVFILNSITIASKSLKGPVLLRALEENEELAEIFNIALTVDVPKPTVSYNAFLDGDLLQDIKKFTGSLDYTGISFNGLRVLKFLNNIELIGMSKKHIISILLHRFEDVSDKYPVVEKDIVSCKLCGDYSEGPLCSFCESWVEVQLRYASKEKLNGKLDYINYPRFSLLQHNDFTCEVSGIPLTFTDTVVTGNLPKHTQLSLPIRQFSLFN